VVVEVIFMTKSMITKVWIGGLAIFAAGLVVAMVGVFLMLGYAGTFAQIAGTNNYDFTPTIDGFFWVTVALISAGGLIGLIGSVVQFVAWVAGMVNSYALPDKAWFWVLLLGGILSFAFAPIGFAAMIAYVIAAPDGSPYRLAPAPPQPSRQQPVVPTA
jgi:hypothetical protein